MDVDSRKRSYIRKYKISSTFTLIDFKFTPSLQLTYKLLVFLLKGDRNRIIHPLNFNCLIFYSFFIYLPSLSLYCSVRYPPLPVHHYRRFFLHLVSFTSERMPSVSLSTLSFSILILVAYFFSLSAASDGKTQFFFSFGLVVWCYRLILVRVKCDWSIAVSGSSEGGCFVFVYVCFLILPSSPNVSDLLTSQLRKMKTHPKKCMFLFWYHNIQCGKFYFFFSFSICREWK